MVKSHMSVATALQIVLDLARQNVIDEREMKDVHAKQIEACDIVEDMAVRLVEHIDAV